MSLQYTTISRTKDNSCVFRIENACAILKCFVNKKMVLDHCWRHITKVRINSHPSWMMEAEIISAKQTGI